ncbi:hypothetical protein PIB30_075634, partial [Stylosanthes scabra]|nr:hypothetical protein [Stylosanthes scabra]
LRGKVIQFRWTTTELRLRINGMKHERISTEIPRKKLLQITVRVAEGVGTGCSLRKMFDRRRRPRSQEAKEDEIVGGERGG